LSSLTLVHSVGQFKNNACDGAGAMRDRTGRETYAGEERTEETWKKKVFAGK